MVHYRTPGIIIALTLLSVISTSFAFADDGLQYGGANIYGFPMSIGLGGTNGAGVPGQGVTYNNLGVNLPGDLTTRYGVVASEVSPNYGVQGSTGGYFGPNWNGITLGMSTYGYPGVNFGSSGAFRDASTTMFSKDLAYEAATDNTFIGFPGFGVGSAGLSFPTITSDKSYVKYAESIDLMVAKETERIDFGSAYTFPLGLGLGYTGAVMDGTSSYTPATQYFFGYSP
ncbi:hypothetical protein CUJ83_02660 [Methanocella sp. CWC-04]|uniref:Uncharacterized protein n=1 Tax=Methanooceanicella nereidis TaxID=2052831 RepID=A0AAP2RAH3_9EURY|nr:hypothetical protein [Methanocella sp. CWC-04]MCD1293899.1 hypothetical protein [Methanocella sp. CWC-04]